jgi:hypothetical protein
MQINPSRGCNRLRRKRIGDEESLKRTLKLSRRKREKEVVPEDIDHAAG